MPKKRYMTAKEASQALNISVETLYSYVSRGLVRSEMVNASKRQRRYYAEDVEKLIQRKEATRNPETVAENVMNWGMPILDSELTLILDDKLYYRGQDACLLAQHQSFEQVAGLLWGYPFEATKIDLEHVSPTPALSPFAQMKIALAWIAEHDPQAFDIRPPSVAQIGTRIITQMAETVAGCRLIGSIAQTLAQGWGVSPSAERLINSALILCADHELNASSTTARIVASTGASPYEVVNAGLSALSGSKHGGHTRRVSALMDELIRADSIEDGLIARLQRGEEIVGFGHRVYAGDDPRARCLLEMMRGQHPDAPSVQIAGTIEADVLRLMHEHATIDFALVILERLYQLPRDSALVIFAIGRMAGWIAHSIEQYQRDHLLRPRARYIGIHPE